jgi:hypothetical protein
MFKGECANYLSSKFQVKDVVCRSWQIRKMVLTTKYVVFGRVKTGEVIDMIPQHEITNVAAESSTASMDEDEDEDGYESSAEASRYVFCIHTIPDGYNSGRMYRLRANSSQNLKMALRNLSTLSRAAAEKATAKSEFRRTQDKVAKVFNNIWTQRVLAIIIFAVIFLAETSSFLHSLVHLSEFYCQRPRLPRRIPREQCHVLPPKCHLYAHFYG